MNQIEKKTYINILLDIYGELLTYFYGMQVVYKMFSYILLESLLMPKQKI